MIIIAGTLKYLVIYIRMCMFCAAHSDYLPLSEDLKQFVTYPEKNILSLDHIYMINLLRRPERRRRMQRLFKELGIQAEIIDAVDGRWVTTVNIFLKNVEIQNQLKYACNLTLLFCFAAFWLDFIFETRTNIYYIRNYWS